MPANVEEGRVQRQQVTNGMRMYNNENVTRNQRALMRQQKEWRRLISYSYSGKKAFDGGGKRPATEVDFSMTGDGGSSSS